MSRVSKHPSTSGSGASPGAIAQLNSSDAAFTVELAPVNSRETPHTFRFQAHFGDGDASRFPEEDDDIKQLHSDHNKHGLWRRTAGEWLAKHLDLWDDSEKFWILEDLPVGYGLFEQITHPKLDVPKRNGPGVMRRDRFIFGHAGRKLRSALSLGKHLSWIISGTTERCECDGCKSTSKAARVPRVVKDPAAAAKRKAKGKGRASLWGGRSDDDDGDDGDDREDGDPSDRGDDDDESEHSPRKKPRMSVQPAPGGRPGPKPKPKAVAGPVFPLPPRHEFTNMTAVREDPSDVLPIHRREDVANPALSRVGELVWAEIDVPHGRTPITHWPAIVQERVLVEGGGEVAADYVVDLIGVSGTLSIEGLGVVPWLSFEEPPTLELVDDDEYDKFADALAKQWTLDELEKESTATVSTVYIRAVHTGKWMATMQLRSVPTIEMGLHLIASNNPSARNTPLQNLIPSTATARYLSHSWLGYGPETLWVGDCVRLLPSVDLPHFAKSLLSHASKASLPTSLVLRVYKLVRGGTGSPLLARGRLFELEEIADSSVSEPLPGPQDVTKDLPPPFPAHRWRSISPSVDVLASEIAGRYYPLPAELRERFETVNEIANQARTAGTVGEGGVGARSLLLAGLVVKDWTAAISAVNGITGGRKEMLAVADEMAMKDLATWAYSLTTGAAAKPKVKGRGGLPARAAKGKGRARLADLLDDDSEMEMD